MLADVAINCARRACHQALLAALLLALLALTGCDRTPNPAGGSPRIVVLSPGLAITLQRLGWEAHIVGRHAFDLALKPSIPVCADQIQLDYERLLRVNPTHVFLEWGARPLPDRLRELGAARGWVVESYSLLTLDDIEHATLRVQRLLADATRLAAPAAGSPPAPGSTDSLAPARDLMDRMRAAWATPDPGLARAGRVLLLVGVAPPSALGPGSFHHQVLVGIGGTPALDADAAPYVDLDHEDLVRLAPDAIVIFAPRAPDPPSATTSEGSTGHVAARAPPDAAELLRRLGRLGELDVPAIRHRRIALIDDPLALTPSPALIDVAARLRVILKGWSEPP